MSQRNLNGKTVRAGDSPPIKREKDIKQEKDVKLDKNREKIGKDIKQDRHKRIEEQSSNPFDRIMNQVHKKPASRPQQG